MSALLAEQAGFDAVWASGLEISTSAALPDANILTMTDFLSAAREMNSATRLPIIADCDTGFGNSNNVIHMVREYESAGIAAVCIEDKLFPKVNSFVPGRQELATPWEFAGKIMAAKHAQELGALVVIARLESLIAGHGLEDALRRADTYHRAGADMILIHSKAKTADPVLGFLKRWQKQCPVVIVPTTYPELSIEDWQEQGVDLIIYANHGIRSAINAMEETYRKILTQRSAKGIEKEIAPLAKVFEIQGMPAMKHAEKQFLKNKPGSNCRAVILAGGTLAPGDLDEKLGGTVERPLLDIYGRSILQRQIDSLSKVGIVETTFVSALAPEKVSTESPVHHLCLSSRGMMDTIISGLEAEGSAERSLLCYSDILFEPQTLEELVRKTDDIVILVDRTFQETNAPRKKSLDLILTEPAPPSDLRALNSTDEYLVTNISKSLDVEESHFEFVGLTLLSARGKSVVREAFARYESEDGEKARMMSLNDFLRRLLADGVTISACEIRRGWSEIHDFEDYKRAIEQVKTK